MQRRELQQRLQRVALRWFVRGMILRRMIREDAQSDHRRERARGGLNVIIRSPNGIVHD